MLCLSFSHFQNKVHASSQIWIWHEAVKTAPPPEQTEKSNFLVAASTWRVIKRCQSYYLGVRRSIGVFSFSVQISANSNTERDEWDGRMIGTIVRCCDFSLQDRRITWISRVQEKTVLFRHRRNFSLPLHKKKTPQTARVQPNGVNRERRCDIIVPTFCTAIVTVD